MTRTLPNESPAEQGIPSNAELGDILDKAAVIIERDGLAQEGYWKDDLGRSPDEYRPGLCCCVAGAITVAVGGTLIDDAATVATGSRDDSHPAVGALLEHLGLAVPFQLFEWNDDSLRTEASVAHTLRECATNLRGAA